MMRAVDEVRAGVAAPVMGAAAPGENKAGSGAGSGAGAGPDAGADARPPAHGEGESRAVDVASTPLKTPGAAIRQALSPGWRWARRGRFARDAAAALRDVALGAGFVYLLWGLPGATEAVLSGLHEPVSPGVDVTEAIRHEAPPHEPEWKREEALRAGLETPDFQDCWDRIDLGGMKNSQRIACLHAERKRLQALLDEQAARLRQSLDPPALAAYGSSMRAWAAWRDRWCELEAARNQAPTPRVNELFCVNELTRELVLRLRKAG